jgi:hypothetical protein
VRRTKIRDEGREKVKQRIFRSVAAKLRKGELVEKIGKSNRGENERTKLNAFAVRQKKVESQTLNWRSFMGKRERTKVSPEVKEGRTSLILSRLTAPCMTREHAIEHHRPQLLKRSDSLSPRSKWQAREILKGSATRQWGSKQALHALVCTRKLFRLSFVQIREKLSACFVQKAGK